LLPRLELEHRRIGITGEWRVDWSGEEWRTPDLPLESHPLLTWQVPTNQRTSLIVISMSQSAISLESLLASKNTHARASRRFVRKGKRTFKARNKTRVFNNWLAFK